MSAEPIILAQDLTKHYRVALKEESLLATLRHFLLRQYRTVKAVEGVSFQIARGEVVGFLGPNGAGKTTTLKMLTGLIHPTRGKAVVAGHIPWRREKAFLKKITLVMGNKQQLIWDLPALDTFRLNAAIYDIPEGEFRKRVSELSEMLSLTNKLHQPVRKLSLGERMKAELLAALLHRPEVLFLDEPTLGLDVETALLVQERVRALARGGKAVLLTTHQLSVAEALADRVAIIHRGSLVLEGEKQALLSRFVGEHYVLELEVPPPAEVLGRLRALGVEGEGPFLFRGDGEALWRVLEAVRPLPLRRVAKAEADLLEVFLKAVARA